jgi:DNA-binding NtrC family response regulator
VSVSAYQGEKTAEPRVLIVDDDKTVQLALGRALGDLGWHAVAATDGAAGIAAYKESSFDVVLLDLNMPKMDGFAVLEHLRQIDREVVVVIMTAYNSTESVVRAMRDGAFDYLSKPFEIDHLNVVLDKTLKSRRMSEELRRLRTELDSSGDFEGLVGNSAAMQRVYALVRQLAPSETSVLIQGETGTGKELVAHALHHLSPHRAGPFMAINCGALPESILESELFGHEKGAFTGAVKRKYGLIEQAVGGTLLLDEIEEMSPALQVKLLRAIQEREVLRVGGDHPVAVDFRLVAAGNVDLREQMEKEVFRADLYYRLSVAVIELPPLRQHVEDVPLLIEYFIDRYGKGREWAVEPLAMQRLRAYGWPGNVRELENTIERALVLCQDGVVTAADLPVHISKIEESAGSASFMELPFREARVEFERQYFTELLHRAGGKVAEAAHWAGIPRQYFYEKMKKLGISRQ